MCDAHDATPVRVTYLSHEEGGTCFEERATLGQALTFIGSGADWPRVSAAEVREARRVTLCERYGSLTVETL